LGSYAAFTCGFGTCFIIGHAALRTRNRIQGFAAAGYGLCSCSI
jgi:hypothetical protein